MQFLYPYFLWAMVALVIPVIIHLFYFRRFKKVYFSNVKFLKEIKEETSNRNKLKELLILISRLLAFAALIFAFAQPFIPKGDRIKQGIQHVSIFVDNSFSMTSGKEDIPLLDIAKERARKIVDSYGEETRFQIITHDLLGKHQRFISRDDVLAYIDEINVTSVVQPLSKVIARQNQLLKNADGDKTIYTISDFQESIFDMEKLTDSIAEINLVPVFSQQLQNVSIDSVWMENHVAMLNQPNYLLVKTTNHASTSTEQVRLSLSQDKQEKPIRINTYEAGTSRIDTIPVVLTSRGTHPITIKISDYPVQFDDSYYAVLNVPDTILALNIYEKEPNNYLVAFFNGLSYFGLKNQPVSQIQYQDFSKYNLIILQDVTKISSGLANELVKYVREGGKVLLFPSTSASPETYNSFLQSVNAGRLAQRPGIATEVSRVNTSEFIFKDVFSQIKTNMKLPKARESFSIQNAGRGSLEAILTNRDGSIFMSKTQFENGLVYVCSSSLSPEVNDLVLNAEIFVPMLYKMAIASVGSKNLAYTISNRSVIEIKNFGISGDQVYKIKGDVDFIPGQKNQGNKSFLDVGGQIKNAGFYKIYAGPDTLETVAFNFNRLESNMKILLPSQIKEKLGDNTLGIKIFEETDQEDMANTITAKDKGISLWKYFLLGALLFLLIETLLIRLWRTV